MSLYSYNDPELVTKQKGSKIVQIVIALLFLTAVWYVLDRKLINGSDWLSPTYDNSDWKTNIGNLPTYGAWDLEAHIWKTEFIMRYFPHVLWNPYWYMGMPLLEYYQPSFYFLHWATIMMTGTSPARAATLLIVFSHLLATFLTFFLCYKLSGRRVLASVLAASFLLGNTFLTLRSYGWEPITVVFLFLFPLGLLFFFQQPLRPFRIPVILILAIAFLSHPLLFFSLCMTMGIYLLFIALRSNRDSPTANTRYVWSFMGVAGVSVLLAGFQFIPQISYTQATSGAHMGLKYLPFYHVPYNIIPLKEFLFDAGNLKGPGPIVMISLFLIGMFAFIDLRKKKGFFRNEIVLGLSLVLGIMVLFYYMELYNIFPMNVLRSIQYHRIIPEFMIVAAAVIAAIANLTTKTTHRVIYYTMLIAFVAATGIIIYQVQGHWLTSTSISGQQEFITDPVQGRISFPYTDQSLSVRNSFTSIPQTYGYYEQGITNSYDDEIFSVSSGFHPAAVTILYLKAANIGRLYVNTGEGDPDKNMMDRLNGTLALHTENASRYGYYDVPLTDPSFAQAVDGDEAQAVIARSVGCRTIFQVDYCGSVGEEFVSSDITEQRYLSSYVGLLETPYQPQAAISMADPDHYSITVTNATDKTAVVVKMTYDVNFRADIDGKNVQIVPFGPDFMLLWPKKSGTYSIDLTYHLSKPRIVGMSLTGASLAMLAGFFIIPRKRRTSHKFKGGDM